MENASISHTGTLSISPPDFPEDAYLLLEGHLSGQRIPCVGHHCTPLSGEGQQPALHQSSRVRSTIPAGGGVSHLPSHPHILRLLGLVDFLITTRDSRGPRKFPSGIALDEKFKRRLFLSRERIAPKRRYVTDQNEICILIAAFRLSEYMVCFDRNSCVDRTRLVSLSRRALVGSPGNGPARGNILHSHTMKINGIKPADVVIDTVFVFVQGCRVNSTAPFGRKELKSPGLG